jgi:DNA-binding SARP family transcriptional activator
MRFCVLGPLEVWSGQDWADISAEKWRVLLACLVLRAGQIVPTEALVAELWGDIPPSSANNLVSIYVNQVRRLIGDPDGHVLVRRKPGYQLKISPDNTDLGRFESLVADGRDALARNDAEKAADLLAEAERLWRGAFLADVPPSLLVSAESERATELRVSAAELRVEANLECGRYLEVIPELQGLAGDYPLRERLWLLLMRALRDAGRHAESLNVYGQARSVIAEELGVDPGPELRQMYADLLAADTLFAAGTPGPAVPGGIADAADDLADIPVEVPVDVQAGVPAGETARETEPTTSPSAGPAQLPPDIADFTGRETQVSFLRDALASADAAPDPGAVRIAVVAGVPGLGKTALAVHAAHQVRDLFPDGQLFVRLSSASGEPAPPGEVLGRFLRELGVNGNEIPAGDEERAALYRTRLTGRRVLILLDDAKDAAQVRPLLPGSASCAVLVTTRNRTPYLVSTGFVDLNTLSAPEALELFSRIVRDGRPDAEPDATAQILSACAGLPLAIRICASRLATRGQWRIATMAARLRDEQRRLDELQVGDLEVRASFQVSYDSLRGGRRRIDPAHAFRLLGLWQGQWISLSAVAALLGEPEGDVADALETLVDANLLESPEPDWYQFHDLLRLFAAERGRAEEPADERHAALARLLRWYLDMTVAAADVVAPHRYRIPLDEPLKGPLEGAPEGAPSDGSLMSSAAAAFAWYDSERAGVIVAIRQASAAGLHDIAWRLPTAWFPVFTRRAWWADCVTAHRIAVNSARAAGSRPGEAWALHNLGTGLFRIGAEEAIPRLEEALAIRRENADRPGEGQTLVSLVNAYCQLRGPEAAIGLSLRCLETLRRAGNLRLLGTALINHGEICLRLGRLDEAVVWLKAALGIYRADEEFFRANALENLGRVYQTAGRADEAIASLAAAQRMHGSAGNVAGQARTLRQLGLAQRDAGQADEARKSLAASLLLFQALNADADAEATRSVLAALA